jgi:hypothetical protein
MRNIKTPPSRVTADQEQWQEVLLPEVCSVVAEDLAVEAVALVEVALEEECQEVVVHQEAGKFLFPLIYEN